MERMEIQRETLGVKTTKQLKTGQEQMSVLKQVEEEETYFRTSGGNHFLTLIFSCVL